MSKLYNLMFRKAPPPFEKFSLSASEMQLVKLSRIFYNVASTLFVEVNFLEFLPVVLVLSS